MPLNLEAVPKTMPSSTIVKRKAGFESAYKYAATQKKFVECVVESMTSELIFPESVELNGFPVGVIFDRHFPLANILPVIALLNTAMSL